MKIKYVLELLLVEICKTFYKGVKFFAIVHRIIAGLLSVMLFAVIPLTALWIISMLPPYWESLILKFVLAGFSFMFLAMVTLRIWRKEKFFALREKYA